MPFIGHLFLFACLVGLFSGTGLVIGAISVGIFRSNLGEMACKTCVGIFLAATTLVLTLTLYAVAIHIETDAITPTRLLFIGALLLPHLLWMRVFRHPRPAAIIVITTLGAAVPEFLAINSAA